MTYEGVLTKMQTEFGTPIQYYLVFENSFLNVNRQKEKNISTRILLRLFLFQSSGWRLDYET
jgi:hypothetical protein